ncbi:MAG TPA: HAD-IIA family hydrolase [Pseudonocardiaceae bacterium]
MRSGLNTLLDDYDAALLDLDGTVYRGSDVVDGAEEAVNAAHEHGVAVRFVTNNASRGPDVVAAQLTELGIAATADEVSTSAQAGARVLADQLPAGAKVFVFGTDALVAEVVNRGFAPVRTADADVAAVVQGLSQDAGWRDLAEACLAIRAGAFWVACNTDATLPTERGLLPGAGALVAALVTATGARPVVAGKPARPLMDDAIAAAKATHPLAVGDRLDTDIAGAHAVGIDSLLVLTGVSRPADLLAAPAELRPTYLAADVRGLLRPSAEVRIGPQEGWRVEVGPGRLRASADRRPASGEEGLLRALCAAWWPVGGGPVDVAASDDVTSAALSALGLAE